MTSLSRLWVSRCIGAAVVLTLAAPAVGQTKKAAPKGGTTGKGGKGGKGAKPADEPPPPPVEEKKPEPEPPPPPPPPPPAPEAAAPAAVTTPTDEAPPEHAKLRLGAGVGVLRRSFSFKDIVTGGLQGYDVSAAFVAEVSAGIFPLATPTPGWEAGVVGGYARSIGLTSKAPDGTSLTTTYDRWQAGLRAERRGATGSTLALLGVDVLYGNTRMEFDGNTASGALPDASYGAVTLGVDGKLGLGPVSLGLRGTGGLVTKLGPLEDRFPHASGGVVGGSAWVGVPISRRIEARLGAELQRFFFKFSPEPGDTFVAGGAVDQFLRGGIDVLFRI